MHTAYGCERGARTMVLMVHGIMGSPDQFRFLADALDRFSASAREQIDCRCALLPGHGGAIQDFASASAEDWLRFIHETVSELRARYERLIYIGHSMGSLLGLIESTRTHFDDMLLISCPLRLKLSLRYPITGIRSALERMPKNPRVIAAKAANSVRCAHPLEYLRAIHPYAELLRLMRRARTISDRAEGVALFSDADEIVSPRSAFLLPRFRIHTLPNSGHFLYSARAQAMIIEETLNAVQKSTRVDSELTQC